MPLKEHHHVQNQVEVELTLIESSARTKRLLQVVISVHCARSYLNRDLTKRERSWGAEEVPRGNVSQPACGDQLCVDR